MNEDGEKTREENRKAAQGLLTAPAVNPELRLLQAIIDQWSSAQGYTHDHPTPIEVYDVLSWAWVQVLKSEAKATSQGTEQA